MGCCSSSDSHVDPVVVEMRRRLSLGYVDERIATKVADREEDRSLLMELTKQSIADIINNTGTEGQPRRQSWTVESETDRQKHQCQSFAQKTIKENGDLENTVFRGDVGFACKKGLKPEAPNQDSFFVVRIGSEMSIYGVFDGHGPAGHDVSDFVKNELPKVLVRDSDLREGNPKRALLSTFEKVQRLLEQATEMGQLSAQFSGTTCTVVLHMHDTNKIYVAHVGDSRCVLGRQLDVKNGGTTGTALKTQAAKANHLTGKHENAQHGIQGLIAIDLTQDHKPDDAKERERIENRGGRVIFDGYYNYRVYAKTGRYPGLNMSRAMGDLAGYYDAGISPVPDVNVMPLLPQDTFNEEEPSEEGIDKFLLLCSDGVWEFLSSQECVNICANFPRAQAQDCAEKLAKESWNRWNTHMMGQVVDDITVVVVYL